MEFSDVSDWETPAGLAQDRRLLSQASKGFFHKGRGGCCEPAGARSCAPGMSRHLKLGSYCISLSAYLPDCALLWGVCFSMVRFWI